MDNNNLKWKASVASSVLRNTFKLIRKNGMKSMFRFYMTGWRYVLKSFKKDKFPSVLLLNITGECNLVCSQCFNHSTDKRKMPFDMLNDIVEEGVKHKVAYIGITGGEPLTRKEELKKIVHSYRNCYFLIYSNSLLLTEEYARELGKYSNIAFFIGIDGPDENTDTRRGQSNYEKILKNLEMLKKLNIPNGVTVMATGRNLEKVTDIEWVRKIEAQGSSFIIYVPYAASGRGADSSLVLSSAQQEYLSQMEREVQKKSGLIVLSKHYSGKTCLFNTGRALYISPSGELGICPSAPFSNEFYKGSVLTALENSGFLRSTYSIHRDGGCIFRTDPMEVVKLVDEYDACSGYNSFYLQEYVNRCSVNIP